MLKSILIHQNDNKGIFKSNFVTSCLGFNVGKPGLLRSHALDFVGCMQLSLGLSTSIATDKQVLKNNKDTTENIYLENKATHL